MVSLPAAVSSWPGVHGCHLLVLLSLPTTEPLRVGTGPISFLYTQPLPYHMCAEWHPVLAPPSCLFATSIDFPIGNQKLYGGWASWCKDGSPRSCHCKRLPRALPPTPPLPADSPFPEHPTSSETKAKNAEGPLGHVTASGWAPGITTGMSGSWQVARTCPCGCPWGVGGGKEWAVSREPPWEVLSPTKRMVGPSTPQPSFCIRKLFWLSLPGMGQEPDLKR